MIPSSSLLMTLLGFICLIGPLVFVHEQGHYWAGRLFGIRIDAFSIGFGREIAGWTDRRGTRWKLGWLPLGGYVRFAGDMNAGSQPSAEWLALPAAERNATFQAKPVWQRAIVVAAGPAVNFVAAIAILGAIAVAYGDPQGPAAVGAVQPNSAAAAAGLRPGDTVIALDGRPVERFVDMMAIVQPRAGAAMRIDYRRGERVGAATITVGSQPATAPGGERTAIGMLGIAPPKPSLLEAPAIGVRRTGKVLSQIVGSLGQIVAGRRSVKELGGPITMARASGATMAVGWASFAFLLALVSINLGFINLLPIPMLDGGHLLFYAIEAVRRRPVGLAAQEWAYRGGLAALLALMLMTTFNDLGAVGLWRGIGQRLAGLIG